MARITCSKRYADTSKYGADHGGNQVEQEDLKEYLKEVVSEQVKAVEQFMVDKLAEEPTKGFVPFISVIFWNGQKISSHHQQLDFEDDDGKREALEKLGFGFALKNPIAVILVTEAWTSGQTEKRPSEAADRGEIILIDMVMQNGESQVLIAEVTRNDNEEIEIPKGFERIRPVESGLLMHFFYGVSKAMESN